VDPHIFQKGA